MSTLTTAAFVSLMHGAAVARVKEARQQRMAHEDCAGITYFVAAEDAALAELRYWVEAMKGLDLMNADDQQRDMLERHSRSRVPYGKKKS